MDELKRFVKVIKWLDQARWKGSGWWDGWKHESVDSLSAGQKVLAHWITYITDMQMSAKIVWTKGLPVFATIVKRYSDGANPDVSRYRINNGDKKVDTLRIDGNLEFTPRYSWHYNQIQRTLEILVDYNRSLVKFMQSILESYHDNKGLRPLAHALYLLTYANPNQYNTENTREILSSSRSKLDSEFHKWDKRTTKGGQKRLWAALRDYVKHDKLRSCIVKDFPSWQRYLEPSDLELPGDVWNNRFAENLIYDLAERAGIDTYEGRSGHNVNAPTLARKVYEEVIRATGLGREFYPEQLDVSFDFASRMCDKDLCDICIFGANKAVDFCSKPGPSKLCPILLILTGYKQTCKVKGCPIVDNTGVGLCKKQNRS